ncbi:UNKNOWN [Stylonychia lemnae]|uniref:Uncharacterized protein n=1 Tax=Stylonychia lemnae TaxID=5949 RepID=A0A077ZWZ0_STYLE|nr:UNKNOWN [Stylonychia lemnae]|eukprot:CDW73792.1 UNKNOWN [Stylonychia lemnae]
MDDNFVNTTATISNNLIKQPTIVQPKQPLNLKKQFTLIQEEVDQEIEINSAKLDKNKSRNKANKIIQKQRYQTLENGMKKVESLFKEIDYIMQNQSQHKPYENLQNKSKQLMNFCSPVYKKQKREFEHKNRKGYMSLVSKIKESSQLVSQVKTGKSLFENTNVTDYHIPVFKEQRLKTDLQDLINKSQDEISVKANKQNLQLMECLSPQKLLKKKMEEIKLKSNSSIIDNGLGGFGTYATQMSNHYSINISKNLQMSDISLQKVQEKKSTQILPSITINRRKSSMGVNSTATKSVVGYEQVEDYQSKPYSKKIEELKNIKKTFDFPNNPAYLFKNQRNNKKLKYLSDYCRENQIAMSKNEEIIMNLDLSKLQHRIWKHSVSELYDYKKNIKPDEDQLIEDFENYGKEKPPKKSQLSMTIDSSSILDQPRQSIHNYNKNWEQNVKSILRKKTIRGSNQGSLKSSNRNSVQSSASNASQSKSNSKNNSYYSRSIMRQSKFADKLTQIQNNKKAIEQKRVQDFFQLEQKRNQRLNLLKQQLENPYLLRQAKIKKVRSNSKRLSNASSEDLDTLSSSEDERRKKQSQSVLDIQNKKKLRRKPIYKLITATQSIKKGKNKINSNLIKLIQRLDLDRPLMLREKLDIIWKTKPKNQMSSISLGIQEINLTQNFGENQKSIQNLGNASRMEIPNFSKDKDNLPVNNRNSTISIVNQNNSFNQRNQSISAISKTATNKDSEEYESLNLRVELEKKKMERMSLNNQQREAYNKLLHFLEKRSKAIQPEEKQFMNIIKIVIDGGWVIREQEFEQILGFIDFKQDLKDLNEKQLKLYNKEFISFFENAIEELRFNREYLQYIKNLKGLE